MYFEYCEFGDLYAMHVLQEQPSLPVDDNETELLAQLGNFGVKAQDPDIPKPKSLSESDIWTLMYQLFAALAYLHYGISISRRGECGIELHWDPHVHRDIKPQNGEYTQLSLQFIVMANTWSLSRIDFRTEPAADCQAM